MSLTQIVQNHKEFKEKHFKEYEELFRELIEKGQSPKTLFIACADSRIDPSLITHTKPGDLFVDRNVGNLVPPHEEDAAAGVGASIEYAVEHLHIENIIVCGHTHCGACKSLYSEADTSNPKEQKLFSWLKYAMPAKSAALAKVDANNKEELLRATERANIVQQLENLLTYPTVQEAYKAKKLFLQGWYYHMESGEIEYYDPIEDTFKPLGNSAS